MHNQAYINLIFTYYDVFDQDTLYTDNEFN